MDTVAQTLLGVIHTFGGQVGLGLIIFTLIVRLALSPLSYFYERSARYKCKVIAPAYSKIAEKYPTRDTLTLQKLFEVRYQLRKKVKASGKVSKYGMDLWFIVIQSILLIAVYQAVINTHSLYNGTFLWMRMNTHDPFYILPIIAVILTVISQILIGRMNQSWSRTSLVITIIFAALVFLFCFKTPVVLVLYWCTLYAANDIQEWVVNKMWTKNRQKLQQSKNNRI